MEITKKSHPNIHITAKENSILIEILGDWCLAQGILNAHAYKNQLKTLKNKHISKAEIQTNNIGAWDSSLICFLIELNHICKECGLTFDTSQANDGIKKLLALASPAPSFPPKKEPHWIDKLGTYMIDILNDSLSMVRFLGHIVIAFIQLCLGNTQMRLQDLLFWIQKTGAEGLPIILLINFLVGFIMAFVGAIQLEKFGATIYIADLVALAMVREMGSMMTAIILSGRTGAAYAASIGSMKITEELDALSTATIKPIQFVVLPRIIALTLMLPLLTIFGDFMGVVGGMIVGCNVMNLNFSEYYHETLNAIVMMDIYVGLIKSIVYGIIISLTGCMRGLECGSDTSAVGDAATSAVVTAITWIIVSDAVIAILFNALNI